MDNQTPRGGADSDSIVLSTAVTHSDWIHGHRDRIGHRRQSVTYILDRCKGVGIQRVYWRCLDGGRAMYASQLMDEEWVGYEPDNYHAWKSPGSDVGYYREEYQGFDSLREAVDYGHQIGLEVHAWLSINEDDHAWGLVSRFCRQHPQFRWVKRSGLPYNSQLSLAFPEVREYKLGLIKEILEYDIDGVFFDWIRTGDVRNEPQATPEGTADFGYEGPLVTGFQEAHGGDPRTIPNNDEDWVRFRAEPQTLFMRAVRHLVDARSSDLPIAIMGHHPWGYRGATPHVNGNLHGLLLDVESWAREGLINAAVASGYFSPHVPGGTPQKAYTYQADQIGDSSDAWLYCWVPTTAEDFHTSIRMAADLGAPQILYWESDYLDQPQRAPHADELRTAMARYAGL
jgi:uncharacterized lipoprotein YddW (UPF0748 family)